MYSSSVIFQTKIVTIKLYNGMKRKMNTDRKSIIESYRKRFEKAIQNKDVKRIMSLVPKCALEIFRKEYGGACSPLNALEIITMIDQEYISPETKLMILEYNYCEALKMLKEERGLYVSDENSKQ